MHPTYPSQPNTTYRLISHYLLLIGITGDQEQQPFDATYTPHPLMLSCTLHTLHTLLNLTQPIA